MRLKYETDRSIPYFNERNFFMSHKLKWNTLTIEVHRLFQWQRVDMWFGSNFCYAFLEIRLVDVNFALSYFIEHVVYRHNPYKIFLGQTKRPFRTAVSLSKKDNSGWSEHTWQTNQTIAWDNSKIITTNRRCHQRCCLEAWHINSADAPLNSVDYCGLLPDAYLQLINQWCRHPKSSIKGNTLQR